MSNYAHLAEGLPTQVAAGRFWNSYATALQYTGQRAAADEHFAKALRLCQSSNWSLLQSYVLQHWGRSLVEQGCFDQAEQCFAEALDIRVRLNEPRQESSRRALEALAHLRSQVKNGTLTAKGVA